jgi:hypothetical protein
LKYHLYCHGKIIEEIFSKKSSNFDTLATFDEYIIKDWWNIHFFQPSDIMESQGAWYLSQSSFDKDKAKALSKYFYSHTTATSLS